MAHLAIVTANPPEDTDVIPYADFKSGLSWDDVRAELRGEQDSARNAGQYMFVSRGTVLGRMRQHKLTAYEHYLRSIGEDPDAWENPPELTLGDVKYLGYEHADDGELYEHDFGPGAEIDTLEDGSLSITHAGGGELHRDYSGQTFLVNPPEEKERMARRAQPRYKSGPKKGQFMSRRAASSKRKRAPSKRKRRNPAPAKRRTTAARRPARRNPPRRRFPTMRGIVRQTIDGTMDAGLVLTGKAAVRTIPLLTGLPKQGNLGLAIQALTALAVSIVSGTVLKPSQAKMVLAGGLTAPLETLIVSYNVPFLGQALQPVEGDAQLSAYMGGYVQPSHVEEIGSGAESIAGYVDDGLGVYGDPNYA